MPLRRILCALLITLALTGCAGGPPAPRPWAETAARELNLTLGSFEVLGRRVAVTRSSAASGPLPVVVYLPGLGQDSDAGQRWAAAWAMAGYAVLTVQPLEDDAAAWRSTLARNGEFRALGELHYGDAMRTQRVAALRRLLAALQAQAQTPQTLPLAAGVGLDWHRAAVAGFETGAQAALDLGAGGAGGTAWQPRAVIAISPPPMQVLGGAAPALIVTSDIDGDALGLVRQPAERRRTFDSLAPGSGWLLSLPALSHAALAGTLPPEGWHEQDQHRGRELGSQPRGGMGGAMGDGQGGGQGPRGPAGGVPRGPRSGSATEAAQADLREALLLSTAFLDAQLRGRAMPVSPTFTAR